MKRIAYIFLAIAIPFAVVSCASQRKMKTLQSGTIRPSLALTKEQDFIPDIRKDLKAQRDTFVVRDGDKEILIMKAIKNDTLQKCIDRLKQWEENPNCPCEIELYYDSAPHSFGFRQVYPDGRTGIVGGLLYHGQPDQSFAVLMNPIHGWTIHT